MTIEKSTYSRIAERASTTTSSNVGVFKQAADDGLGKLPSTQTGGSINYATGAIHFMPTDVWTAKTWSSTSSTDSATPSGAGSGSESGSWGERNFTDNWSSGSLIRALYQRADAIPVAASTTLAPQPIRLNLTPYSADAILPGSVTFVFAGATYTDNTGLLYANGVPAGNINYTTGECDLTWWPAGVPATFDLLGLLTIQGEWTAIDATFRAGAAPIKPEALQVTVPTAEGTFLIGTADATGAITGAGLRGQVDYEHGTAWVEFGDMGDDPEYTGLPPIPQVWLPTPVPAGLARYNAVAFSYLPLDADVLGIDPVRLPSDGRVPIYRPGDVVMVMHSAETAPATVANGGTIDCGRTRLAWVRVIDATGASAPSGYTLDRATGIVTFTDVSGMTMPVTVRHTVGDLRQITDAQISGHLTLARPLSHPYPAEDAIVASCLIHGDRRARVSAVWDQATWNGTWADTLVGSESLAALDVIAHPIEVTNEGAETERWLLRWTSTTNVELIGERRGLVYSGPFTADIAPINPRTRNTDGTGGAPYLHIPLAANGGGWSAGNVVRINTVGALADIWIARSIQQSDIPLGDGEDGVELYALGNIDRP